MFYEVFNPVAPNWPSPHENKSPLLKTTAVWFPPHETYVI